MERSIREAVRIAKTVKASIETDDSPAADKEMSSPNADTLKTSTGTSASSDIAPSSKDTDTTANSDLNAVIDEALSGEETPTYKTKDE